MPTSKLSSLTFYHIYGTLQLQYFMKIKHQPKQYLNCKFGSFRLVMIVLLIQYGVSLLFIHLPPDTKIKTNLSVIILITTIMAILLMSVIGLVVAKRGNFHLALEREKRQKKVPPTLAKMNSEKYYLQK